MHDFCNMCGEVFDFFDEQENFHFIMSPIGYGSIHDGEFFDCHLCCRCFDKTFPTHKFKVNPFTSNLHTLVAT